MKSLIAIILIVGLIGLSRAEDEELATKRECLKDLEKALENLVITPKIKQMLAVMSELHPNTPFVEIMEPIEEAEKRLVALGFPEDCDTFMSSFVIHKDQASCMDSIDFDDDFKHLIGQNKRIDELLGASSVCLLVSELIE